MGQDLMENWKMSVDGYTLMHEHVTIDLSGVKNDQDCHLDCYEETVKEFKKLYACGVRNIVEVTNIGMGRNIQYIQNVEKETGIHIINSNFPHQKWDSHLEKSIL